MSQTVSRDEVIRVAPVTYQPRGEQAGGSRRGPSARVWALIVVALAAALAAGFFGLARAVLIDISPAPDAVDLSGGFGLAIGDRRLLLAGDYALRARKDGYEDLAADVVVTDAPEQSFRFEMKRLPGKLSLISDPAGAEAFVDNNARGITPLADLELSAGAHRLLLRAPRYQAFEADVMIEGGGIAQTFNARLVPGWAPVSVSSKPAGAEILLDGVVVGRTPQTIEVGAGVHELNLRLSGYRSWRDSINVRPNEPLQLAEVRLLAADGNLQLSSRPSGASVTVDGAFRGLTPLGLNLPPGRTHSLRLSAPGHRPAERSVELASEQSQELSVDLEPILGSVVFAVEPADARISVDGQPLDSGTTRLQLTAVPHKVEVSKAGFATQSTTVTPRESLEQRVELRLVSDADARVVQVAARASSGVGLTFVLVKPGAFTMGSERGTQGRQSNEAQRKVRLTRPFYLATTEVTNAQYRRFMPKHSSGIVNRNSLDNETQPAVRLSWEDAVRYCNWLSAQDGLPSAYVEDGSGWKLAEPVNTGYRLPSEAEWEWAARFAGGSALRYAWGAAMPPPAGAGNFAGSGSEGVAQNVLDGYDDGFIVASPVGSFAANNLGLFDMGGNVAEWTHDRYSGVLAINPGEAVDPFGPETGAERVIRGSSWADGGLVPLRLAYRTSGSEGRPDLGVRVARYAQ